MNDTTPKTITLYRPTGPKELALIEATGNREFPPRLPDQPIFYPACNERYATEIAEKWNVRDSGSGFVTRFEVRADYLQGCEPQIAGARYHEEYWMPTEELLAFNAAIVGTIEVIECFPSGAKGALVSAGSSSSYHLGPCFCHMQRGSHSAAFMQSSSAASSDAAGP